MLKVLIFAILAYFVAKMVGEAQDLVPYLWSQGRRIEAIGVGFITILTVVLLMVCSFS
jgi:hypothetical protein